MKSRIPALKSTDIADVGAWMIAMSVQGLQFHPEDNPAEIFSIRTGARTFTDAECKELVAILDRIYEAGQDPCELWLDADRMIELRQERSFCTDGPNVWASRNPEAASELTGLEERYGNE